MKELPLYVCHKEVRALKILAVEFLRCDTTTDENEIVAVHFEDESYEPIERNLKGKPRPDAGWYFILYNDGYESFSPAKAFEEGYTLKSAVE